MGCTGPKCTRKEQAWSKNLDDRTLSNQHGQLISREEQRIPNASNAQRRFTAEEKGKSVVLDSPAADPSPSRGERYPQAHFSSGPAGGHSAKKAAWTPSGGLADTPEANGECGGRSRGGPRRPKQNLPPTSSSSWQTQAQASVFSLPGNGNPFAGRCFRCLASDHRVAECPHPIRCILCLNFGHRATDCRSSSYHHMWFIHRRPEIVRACAAFSAAMVTSERDLGRRAVIAAVTGGSPAVSRRQVAQAFAVRFQIAEDDVEVSLYSQDGDYLVSFKNPAVHGTDAFGSGFPSYLWVESSQSALKITPWARQSLATAVVQLRYKVRLCIEGVPRHAWQVETVARLLHPTTLIEAIDRSRLSDKESACLCVWVWTDDPNCFEEEVDLQIEELPERADDIEPWHYPELGFVDQRRRRQPCFQPVRLLSYRVLLHIDRVINFSPAAAASFQPWIHEFRWEIGVKDGDLPPTFSLPT